MSVNKKDVARVFDQWWFGSSLYGLGALFLWMAGAGTLLVGMALGAGLASFVRLFWSSKGNQEGVESK